MGTTLINGLTIWSFKKEFLFVLATFLLVLLIPVFSVLVIADTGLNFVSNTLARVDQTTHKVQLYYPNGTAYKQIDATITWPVKGVVTLEFGEPELPFSPFHTGIDIANAHRKIGDPITPFMPGEVIFAGEIPTGLGKHVIIDNGDNITSYYGHLSAIYVTKGMKVKSGDVIGAEGESGWATGPHLHFQVDVWGVPVNPRIFLGYQEPL